MEVETETQLPRQDIGGMRAQNGSHKRALIVDDEPATAALIQQVLASAGIDSVTLAANVEADSQLQKEKFDVVVVDLSMPSADGHELVRKIRQSGFNKRAPIIVISQDQCPGATVRAFEAGASFLVYKPIDRARLAKLILVAQGTIDQEKRRFRRIPIHAKALLRTSDTELIGETIDISMNGVLVTASRMIPVGSLAEVSLYLVPGTAPIVGLGTVVRILSGTQMGILLDRRSVEESTRLEDYLLPKIEGGYSSIQPWR